MKRLVSIICTLGLVMSLASCSSEETNTSSENSNDVTGSQTKTEASSSPSETSASQEKAPDGEAGNDTLVVVFSCTGTTKGVAEKIVSVTGADFYEITAAEPYTDDDRDWTNDSSRCSVEQDDKDARPAIGSEPVDLSGYEVIYIGYPIWFGQEPRIMDTFVESYDFGTATVIPFCTSGSSGIGSSGTDLAANAESGNWLAGKRFDSGVTEDEIREWIGTDLGLTLASTSVSAEENEMILKISDNIVSVKWEDNDSVKELKELAAGGLTINMSMYGGFEQVGSIGSSITRNDVKTTTSSGDIVLYSGDQIVIFYGSNTWDYTKLGKIDLSEDEITSLLSKGDVTITLET